MKEKGALILFPNVLGKGVDARDSLPEGLADVVAGIDGIIAESTQGGRSFLKKFKTKKKPHNMPLAIFNKDSEDDDIDFLLEPLADGERWGYVSAAGLPCIPAPGNDLV
ncbi:MAG: 16S rRNA methyltransferase, partial [Waddliaceae bacterium]|nr:16S rRNA methyltransferase [Waddliaceae bacterium]